MNISILRQNLVRLKHFACFLLEVYILIHSEDLRGFFRAYKIVVNEVKKNTKYDKLKYFNLIEIRNFTFNELLITL